MTAAEWCEVQVAFGLQRPDLKRRTAAMHSGSFRHRELELAMGVEEIEVAADSEEDFAAVKLVNTAAGITQLLSPDAATGELFVFGWAGGAAACGGGAGAEQAAGRPTCQEPGVADTHQQQQQQQQQQRQRQPAGVFLTGVIDELRLTANPANGSRHVCVVERKTRASRSAPRAEQVATSRLQVMLYRQLLQQLRGASAPGGLPAFCEAMGGLDPSKPLSAHVAAEAAAMFGCGGCGGSCGGSGCPVAVATLADAMALLHARVSRLPPVSEQLLVIWEAQGSAEVIWEDRFKHHPRWLASRAVAHAAFWRGAAAPVKVLPEQAAYKCGFCPFAGPCASLECAHEQPPDELF